MDALENPGCGFDESLELADKALKSTDITSLDLGSEGDFLPVSCSSTSFDYSGSWDTQASTSSSSSVGTSKQCQGFAAEKQRVEGECPHYHDYLQADYCNLLY